MKIPSCLIRLYDRLPFNAIGKASRDLTRKLDEQGFCVWKTTDPNLIGVSLHWRPGMSTEELKAVDEEAYKARQIAYEVAETRKVRSLSCGPQFSAGGVAALYVGFVQ